MKFLYTIASVNPAGGGPIESLKKLAPVLAEAGHTTEVVSLDVPDSQWVREFPLPVYALGTRNGGYGYTPRLVPWLRHHAGDYDAVVVRGIWQYHSFGTWRALHGRVPYVAFTHGMLDPWFKHAYPLKHAKKWLYWPWAEYRVLRDAEAVLFTCEQERLLARESFWLYCCNERVVNYGTAAPQGDPCAQTACFFARHPQLRGKRIALFVGRIHEKKGCDLLIEAFARVFGSDPDWYLVIAGPDQVGWQAKLMQLASSLGIAERVVWPGMIAGDIKWGALHAAEIFVLPSHQENFGIVVAEALACGVPTLISSQVNIWREVQDDGVGLVASDNLEGTCALLQSWKDMPDAEKAMMRSLTRLTFDRRFDIRRAAESLVAAVTR